MKNSIFFFLIGIALAAQSQNPVISPKNEAAFSNEESYKSISFLVNGISNEQQRHELLNLIRSIPGIFMAEFSFSNSTCSVEAGLDVEKRNIVEVTGHNGYKISEYREDVHLVVKQNVMTDQQRKMQQNVRDRTDIYYREDIKDAADKETIEKEVGVTVSSVPVINPYDKMTVMEKIKHIESLKVSALERGEPVEKYDIRLIELKAINNNFEK